jgi:hypothetical protein
MLSAIMLSVIMLSVIMLSVIMPSVIMLSVIILSVIVQRPVSWTSKSDLSRTTQCDQIDAYDCHEFGHT